MEISAQNLQALFTGFDVSFQKGFAKAPSYYEKICSIVPSTSRITTFPWLGRTTGFREWIGERMIQALEAHTYTIQNKTFEDTVGIEREVVEDDEYGVYTPVIEQLGWDSKTHPDQLIFGMMKAAVSGSPATIGKITIPVPLAYDGQNLYSASHPVGPMNEAGNDTTVSNLNSGGSGPYWFLVDGSRPILPFIFQMRRNYAVTRMNTVTDEAVFSQRIFRYGVDVRCNAGVGLWQLTYASNEDLTNPANFGAAITAIKSIKSDAGVPFGAWTGRAEEKFLVVPPALEEAASQLQKGDFGAINVAGAVGTPPGTNIYKGTFTLIVSEWLA